jgi:hypothetical protein
MDEKVVKLRPHSPRVGSQEGIVDGMHALAKEVADGDWGELDTVVILMEGKNGAIHRHSLTVSDHFDRQSLVGLLEYAKHMVICPRDD